MAQLARHFIAGIRTRNIVVRDRRDRHFGFAGEGVGVVRLLVFRKLLHDWLCECPPPLSCEPRNLLPYSDEKIRYLIARACERDISATWPRKFCERCGGRHYTTNSCPFCKLQQDKEWRDEDFFQAMVAHRERMPEVYDGTL